MPRTGFPQHPNYVFSKLLRFVLQMIQCNFLLRQLLFRYQFFYLPYYYK